MSGVATGYRRGMQRILEGVRHLLQRRGVRGVRRRRRWHPPLLYERTMDRAESEAVWRGLAERWGDSLGYPLTQGAETRSPAELIACDAAAFERALPPEQVRALLAAQGVERVWELTETAPDRDLDLGLVGPFGDNSETHWTSESLDWMLYASHENSLTVDGAWLIAAVQARWLAWELHLW